MKKFLLVFVVVLLLACNKTVDLSLIEKGMTRNQVVKLIGEPNEEQEMFMGISWMFYDGGSIVIIEADTVVNCSTAEEMQKGFEELGETVDSLVNEIENFDF